MVGYHGLSPESTIATTKLSVCTNDDWFPAATCQMIMVMPSCFRNSPLMSQSSSICLYFALSACNFSIFLACFPRFSLLDRLTLSYWISARCDRCSPMDRTPPHPPQLAFFCRTALSPCLVILNLTSSMTWQAPRFEPSVTSGTT